MKNTPQWFNKLRRGVNELTKNSSNKQIQNQLNLASEQMKKALNSTSKQMQKSLHNHYQNIPQYNSQINSQLCKTTQKSKQLSTELHQKFHEFSQSNPTMKRYHSKYTNQVDNISKNMPNFNVKKSIDSTLKQSKKIASNVQSTAKQISDTSKKVTSTVSSTISTTNKTISNLPQSASKMASTATKPIYSTYKTTQKILNPKRWRNKLFNYFSQMKMWLMIYGCVGIASLMIVNQLSYMGLLYMIRHRYEENNKITLFGVDMVWIYHWLNIPFDGDIHSQRIKLLKDQNVESQDDNNINNNNDYVLNDHTERQIEDYNISADIKLAKMAYHGLLYPRIGAAMLLTVVVGTPLLRVVLWFKR